MQYWQSGLLAALFSGSLLAAPMPVVTSFSILGDVAQQIGGERVQVQSLVGPDQDAHAPQLDSSDIRQIRAAKLVLLSGLGFEKADLVRAVKQSKVPVAVASAGIKALHAEETHDHNHSHDRNGFDPHVWHDPVLMQAYAHNVAAALMKADPAGKAHYQQRLQNYQAELGKLHAWAVQSFQAVDPAKRKVFTGHDAFGYMAKRYNIRFIAPQGASSEAEPSARQVAAIIRQIRQQGVKAVFAENIKDSRTVARIAKETGTRVQGKLHSDALSKTAPANTYTGMFRHNVQALGQAME